MLSLISRNPLHVSQSYANHHHHQIVKDLQYLLLQIYFHGPYVSLKKAMSNDYVQCPFETVKWALTFDH